MALLKKILKNSKKEVIVKWTGSGADTLTLASLVATDQTLTGTVNPGATIVTATVSTSGATTVTRNSEVALQLNGNFDYQTAGSICGVISENPTSDIVVNLAALGTLVLKINKTQGYSE